MRYADDLIITGNSREWLEDEVKHVLVEFLAERGLALSMQKTKVAHIRNGFDFLGWNFRKYNGKLLMKPSKANVNAHLDKIREVIKAKKTAKQTGAPDNAAQSHSAGMGQLSQPCGRQENLRSGRSRGLVDAMAMGGKKAPEQGRPLGQGEIFQVPRRSQLGICRDRKKEDGTKKEHVLLRETDTPIVRHIKIKAGANPHDPLWESYFEDRWVKAMLNSGRGRSKLYRDWLRQDRNCPECNQPITKSTPWAFRHIVKRVDGEADAAGNLQMHHLNYYRQQHAE